MAVRFDMAHVIVDTSTVKDIINLTNRISITSYFIQFVQTVMQW